ncbi:MAG: type VI secretion system contractile sheath large subunit [Bacteroidetes Order II. Incertae sedis bacterium]|nr:type VI secretion system contractile sheath large subunit [Bacteroidetes Order II. bacterium]
MSATQQASGAPGAQVQELDGKDSLLDSLFAQVNMEKPSETVNLKVFKEGDQLANQSKNEMMAAALSVFVDTVAALDTPLDRLDKHFIDAMVASIDQKISQQLDAVMHHPTFQKMESSWRGLKFMVDRIDFRKNVKVEILDVDKDELAESFEDSPELIQSPLYKHIYTDAYDQPGATPYATIVSNFEFDSSAKDVNLLTNMSKVAASAHCPFLGSIGPKFFGKSSMEEWKKIPDLGAYMETSDYIKWNAFRATDDSRYVGLTMPRFMARLPYGDDNPVKAFNYQENVKGSDHDKYLWANATFAMATNMAKAFMADGWSVQIRGPEAGGKVEDLPVHLYDVGKGKQLKTPTEVPISETLEFQCANLGFIPLSHYQNRDFACFFSANSAQKAKIYDDEFATANSRINSRLPYIFLASRISHYLKVMQRENIGSTKSRVVIEEELNRWLKSLVTEMSNPSPAVIARYPLKGAQVTVSEVGDNPGFYRVETMIMPHFQIEGMDINLSLVGKMPAK